MIGIKRMHCEVLVGKGLSVKCCCSKKVVVIRKMRFFWYDENLPYCLILHMLLYAIHTYMYYKWDAANMTRTSSVRVSIELRDGEIHDKSRHRCVVWSLCYYNRRAVTALAVDNKRHHLYSSGRDCSIRQYDICDAVCHVVVFVMHSMHPDTTRHSLHMPTGSQTLSTTQLTCVRPQLLGWYYSDFLFNRPDS